MTFCAGCGSTITQGSGFCAGCGKPVATVSQGSVAAAPSVISSSGASGLTPNLAGALAYILGLITGVLFLVLEPYKRDPFVRFHAMQSVLYSAAVIVFSIAWRILVSILSDINPMAGAGDISHPAAVFSGFLFAVAICDVPGT